MALSTQKLHELRRRKVGAAGNRLADVLELSGETATALAEATALTLQYISDTKAGRYKTITVENAGRIARFFGVAIEDIFLLREAMTA
jgi:transcriptional regulator with XRE-family HTH domain